MHLRPYAREMIEKLKDHFMIGIFSLGVPEYVKQKSESEQMVWHGKVVFHLHSSLIDRLNFK